MFMVVSGARYLIVMLRVSVFTMSAWPVFLKVTVNVILTAGLLVTFCHTVEKVCEVPLLGTPAEEGLITQL